MAKEKEKTGSVYDENGKPYNYVIVIDAGSSGSRLHVYSYPDTSYNGKMLTVRDKTEEKKEESDDGEDNETDEDKKEDEDRENEEKTGENKDNDGNDGDDKEDGKSEDSTDSKPEETPSTDTPSSGEVALPAVSKQGFKWVKKTKPGISSFAKNPSDVGKKHLKSLLKYAEKVIPSSQHHRTPIFLHATGGMRILEQGTQDKILQNTCDYIKSKTDFFIPDCGTHVNVISGDVEGIFGWLAVNYLIGGIQDPAGHEHGKGHSTYGLLEMGGASTQVAFVPNATEIDENTKGLYGVRLASMDGKADKEYKVSSTTFLGLGVNEVQRNVLKQLGSKKENPCDPKGLQVNYNKDGRRIIGKAEKDDDSDSEDESDDEEDNKVATKTKGTGNYAECQALLKPLVKDVKSTIGADFDFDVNHFIGVSEYWDTAHDGFQMGGKFDYSKLETKVKEFCETPWKNLKKDHKETFKGLNLEELESLCLRTSWILNMVENGLGLPQAAAGSEDAADGGAHDETLDEYLHPLQSVEEINGNKYTWTLGRAVLYASAEQSVNDSSSIGSGITMKNSDAAHLLYGADVARPPFDPKSAGKNKPTHDDDKDDDGYDWDDILEHHSKRLWGSLLFLLILVVILYLLLGKVRRNLIWQSIKTRIQHFRGAAGGAGPKYTAMRRQGTEGTEDDLELGTIEEEGADEFSVTSDGDDDDENTARGRRS